jgi:hypothetical protein
VRELALQFERAWEPNPAEVRAAIPDGTKLVVATNPHNPSGHVLSADACERILRRVAEVGAWLLADEVYQGAERSGVTTPSFWGRYERLVVVAGLSKAYGLPGLRIGWVVADPGFAEEAWNRHDYTTIGPSGITDHLAALALGPGARERILARTRAILNENYPVIETWLRGFGDAFAWHPPEAGAICYARYRPAVSGIRLIEHLRAAHDVLLVPGEHFGMPGYIRFGMGNERGELVAALAETARGLRELFHD